MKLHNLISVFATSAKTKQLMPKDLRDQLRKINNNNLFETLKYYADKNDNYLIHFTDAPNKFSVNIKQNFGTPFGTCGYILNETLVTHKSAFAKDRKFINIFKCYGNGVVTNQYTQFGLEQDIQQLYNHFGNEIQDIIRNGQDHAKNDMPFCKIFNITRLLAKENPRSWSKILVDVLGYDYIIDPGDGIIHTNEPAQAIALCNGTSSPKIQLVTTIDNNYEDFEKLENYLQQNTIACYYCGKLISEGQFSLDNKSVCQQCKRKEKRLLNKNVKVCSYCKGIFPIYDIKSYNNYNFCEPCYKYNTTTCNDCNKLCFIDDTIYVHDIKKIYCKSCAQKHINENQ